MPNQGFKKSPDRGKKVTTKSKTKHKMNPKVQRAQEFTRDIDRGGPPSEISEQLEQEEPDITEPDIEKTELDDEKNELFDSEVEITDDDDWSEDDWLDDFHPSRPASMPESWQMDLTDRLAITVYQGKATFRIPDWATKHQKVDLEDRWNTYHELANWLNRERPDFLREPTYLNLGKDSFDFGKPIPVMHEGLHTILEPSASADRKRKKSRLATFSKHCHHGVILWESSMMKLEDLWGQEAKLAWFAQAVIKRQRERGYLDRNSLLASPEIQPRRNKKDRDTFVERNKSRANRLGPEEYVALLCCLTGCKWQYVLDRYTPEIFYNEDVR